MGSVNAAEAVAGLALVFVLPGFALARATFPEWRFRGPGGTIHMLETLSLSLIASVGLTIVIGFGLLSIPVGFQSTWSDPILLEALAGVAVVGLAVALIRGAFDRVAPEGQKLEPEPGTEGAFATIRELDRLRAQERRVVHQLRVLGHDDAQRSRLDAELNRLRTQSAAIVAQREAEERAL